MVLGLNCHKSGKPMDTQELHTLHLTGLNAGNGTVFLECTPAITGCSQDTHRNPPSSFAQKQ